MIYTGQFVDPKPLIRPRQMPGGTPGPISVNGGGVRCMSLACEHNGACQPIGQTAGGRLVYPPDCATGAQVDNWNATEEGGYQAPAPTMDSGSSGGGIAGMFGGMSTTTLLIIGAAAYFLFFKKR